MEDSRLSYLKPLFLISFLLFYIVVECSGQNPLDIKSRVESAQTARVDSTTAPNTSKNKPISQEQPSNPFDVNQSGNNEKTKEVTTSVSERVVNEENGRIGFLPRLGILLGLLVFFVFNRGFSLEGFNSIFSSLINQTKLISYRASFNGWLNIQLALFYLFFILNAAYFIYLSAVYGLWHPPFFGFKLFVYVALGVLVVYLVKYVALSLIEYAFDIRRALSHHMFSITLLNVCLGMVLFVINIFYAFSQGGANTFLFYLGIVAVILAFVYRQLRGLTFIGDLRQFNFVHFFLYLCACEISPLLVAVKFVTS